MISRSRAFPLLALLVGLALVMSIPRASQADGPLSVATNVPAASKAHGMALQDDLAYVATETGLPILDIANPASPVIIGVLPARGSGDRQGGPTVLSVPRGAT